MHRDRNEWQASIFEIHGLSCALAVNDVYIFIGCW